MSDKIRKPADGITPISINGLNGRMLVVHHKQQRQPAELIDDSVKKHEILFVYGHHSTLERWRGLIDVFSQYGNVTMPDLPGLGGMDSFYKIDSLPTIDGFADYLAAFIKLHYGRKRIVIVGMSFGFVVVTRMLQQYPDLAKRVDLLISVAGFTHYQDFIFSTRRRAVYRLATAVLSRNPVAWLFRHIALASPVLRAVYAKTSSAKLKFDQAQSQDEFKTMMQTEIILWHVNDVRTHWSTAHEFMYLNNCHRQVDLPVWHIAMARDHFFDNHVVEQHMRVIFTDFRSEVVNLPNHAPSVIADAEMAEPFVPDSLRKALLELT